MKNTRPLPTDTQITNQETKFDKAPMNNTTSDAERYAPQTPDVNKPNIGKPLTMPTKALK